MNLQLFTRPDAGQLRAFVDLDGLPWFCATDVTSALGYTNGRDAVARHCREGGVVKHDTPTSSGVQPLSYLSEANLYRLVMRSKAEGAERFQDWVCEDVLPAIRRNGQYAVAPITIPATYGAALRLAADKSDEVDRLTAELVTVRPAAALMNSLQDAGEGLSMEEVAKTLAEPQMGQNNLFKFLRERGVIMPNTTRPYQRYIERGLFKTIQQTFVTPSGEPHLRSKTVVLLKGV